MLHNTYAGQTCSVARALEVVGERWTLLILRDAFLGVRRFDQFQQSLGIARNVLNTRLQRLVEAGLLEREQYQERPARYEYRLTDKALDLWPVVLDLMRWGDKHLADAGPPVLLEHRDCGGRIGDRRECETCGTVVTSPRDVRAVAGPGAVSRAAAR